MRVRRALVSVHDKTGVVDFARALAGLGVEILSTGGTARLLRESGLSPVFYFPMEDVRMDLLSRTEHRTRCPFKGDASYWSIQVGDRRSDDIAWAYEDPLPGRSDLQGRVAFYADRLDALEVSVSQG